MEKAISLKELWIIKKRITSYIDTFYYKRAIRLQQIEAADNIIEKFSFKTMQKECPEFCTLIKEDKPCHDLGNEELNCYGCFCPNYQVEISIDKEKNLYQIGQCKINSKFGHYKQDKSNRYLILTCINCKVPHYDKYIQQNISKL